MTNQTTDEAAVDILERLRFSHSQGFFEAIDKGMHVSYEEAADEIETLRAQLTAATRRAEQAERMLSEAGRSIDLALQCTPSIRGHNDFAEIIYDCGDPWEILRTTLTTIRSAASGRGRTHEQV